jgi:hypothetical protein
MRRNYRNDENADESVYELVQQGQDGKHHHVVSKQKVATTPKSNGSSYITGPHRNHVDTVANILNPVNGYRDRLARKGIEPKNHMAENRQRLRDESRINKLKKETEGASPEAFKLKKFRDVEPKVPKILQEASQAGEGHEFIRKGQGATSADAPRKEVKSDQAPDPYVEPIRELARDVRGETNLATGRSCKPAVPRASEQLKLAPRDNTDFVRRNFHEVPDMAPKKAPKPEMQEVAKPSTFGKVPAYLKQRKLEMQQDAEAREQQRIAAQAPPGMVLLSEEERVETLRVLRSNKEKLEKEQQKLPLRIETPSMVKKSKELEQKIKEVEEAIAMFNRPKVYVAE